MEEPIEQRFSTWDVAAPDRRDHWCEEVSEQWSATTFEWLGNEPAHASVVMRSYAGSLCAESKNTCARIARPKRLIERAPDCYNLVLHLGGQGVYRQGGREAVVAQGDLVVLAATEPFDMTLSNHHVRSWVLPKAVLEPMLADPSFAINTHIPGGSVLGGLLGSYLDLLWQSFGRVDLETAAALDSHLYHLLAIHLGSRASELDEGWEKCARAVAGTKHMALDAEKEQARRERLLQERYGLSKAEVAFAIEIIKGDGRNAAAKRRGISPSTAHSHLTSIFEKTSTHRQAELVRVILEAWMGC